MPMDEVILDLLLDTPASQMGTIAEDLLPPSIRNRIMAKILQGKPSENVVEAGPTYLVTRSQFFNPDSVTDFSPTSFELNTLLGHFSTHEKTPPR